jgi:hypothetical protein
MSRSAAIAARATSGRVVRSGGRPSLTTPSNGRWRVRPGRNCRARRSRLSARQRMAGAVGADGDRSVWRRRGVYPPRPPQRRPLCRPRPSMVDLGSRRGKRPWRTGTGVGTPHPTPTSRREACWCRASLAFAQRAHRSSRTAAIAVRACPLPPDRVRRERLRVRRDPPEDVEQARPVSGRAPIACLEVYELSREASSPEVPKDEQHNDDDDDNPKPGWHVNPFVGSTAILCPPGRA